MTWRCSDSDPPLPTLSVRPAVMIDPPVGPTGSRVAVGQRVLGPVRVRHPPGPARRSLHPWPPGLENQ